MEQQTAVILELARAYNQYYSEAFEQGAQALEEGRVPEYELESYLEGLRMSLANDSDGFLRHHQLSTGQSAADFLDGLETQELLPAFDRLSCLLCEDLPDRLRLRLGRDNQELQPALRQRAFAPEWKLEPDADFADCLEQEGYGLEEAQKQIRRAALGLLGQWRDPEARKLALAHIKGEAGSNLDEYQAESLQTYFRAQAPAAVKDLLELGPQLLSQELESGQSSNRLDYVQILLVEQIEVLESWEGAEDKEAVFQFCRDCLRKRSERVISAILLGQLGDPRAIPLLRRMAEKSYQEQDRQLHYECLAALERLGADCSDLPRLPLRRSALQS